MFHFFSFIFFLLQAFFTILISQRVTCFFYSLGLKSINDFEGGEQKANILSLYLFLFFVTEILVFIPRIHYLPLKMNQMTIRNSFFNIFYVISI